MNKCKQLTVTAVFTYRAIYMLGRPIKWTTWKLYIPLGHASYKRAINKLMETSHDRLTCLE